MSSSPNRTFLILAILMLVLFITGLVAVSYLIAPRTQGDSWTTTAFVQTNDAIAAAMTGTAVAMITQMPRTEILTVSAPYEPTLYARRQTLEWNIMASMGPTEWQVFAATETALVATYQAEATPPARTAPPTFPPCFFNWATQDLPELSAEVQSAMNAAGLENVTVTASAYGENCYANDTNEVVYFATMTTDFHVTAAVDDPEDEEALGDLTAQILVVLNEFPPDATPGPMPGQISLTFVGGEQQQFLSVGVQYAAEVIEQGLTGAVLWDALVE